MGIEVSKAFASQVEGLGEPIAEFRTSALQRALFFGVGVWVFGAGLVMLVFQAIPEAIAGRAALWPVVLGFAWVALTFVPFAQWNKLRRTRVVAFDRGLVRFPRGKCEVMRWEEIAVVGRGVPPGQDDFTITTPSRLALMDSAGREWVFTETLTGLKKLRQLVEEKTLPHLLADALEALHAGKTLAFADLGVKREGVTCQGTGGVVGWALVTAVGIQRGQLEVDSSFLERPVCVLPIYQVPNVHLLLALVEHFRSGGPSGIAPEGGFQRA